MSSQLCNEEDGNNQALNLVATSDNDKVTDHRMEYNDAIQKENKEQHGEEEEEEGEGEEAEEDDDNDEENDGYTFRFEGEMDPLTFAEDDAFGVQPYQQFERLEHEYEALAEKKRKALQDHQCDNPFKKSRLEDVARGSMEEIMELMNYGRRRKSRKSKKRGRKKGSKNKLNPEVTRKLGDATLHYAHGRFEEAIHVLNEVVRIAPNLPDPYHTLGLVYNAIGDKKKALNFYMLAAHLNPKDSSLWKLLVSWSIEQGNAGQARYCLSKAITADPADISLRLHRASLYVELGEYQKAAESYEQISRLSPENTEALKTATMLYKRCGLKERSASILEEYLRNHPSKADLHVVDLLASICIKNNAFAKALEHIEHSKLVYCGEAELPLDLRIKAGICHVHLGNIDKAETIFNALEQENLHKYLHLVNEVADTLMTLEHYKSALKYYLLLEGNIEHSNGFIEFKIAQCYVFMKERVRAIEFLYKESNSGINSDKVRPWWLAGKIKLKLCHIYKAKGMIEDFVDAIFPSVRESLFLETIQQKVRVRRRLPKSVLFERAKVLDDCQTDNVFHGFRPLASTSDLSKASRAKKLLRKKATQKEAKKAAALAAGLDWKSDNSDDDSPQAVREPPLPNLLKDDQYHNLLIDLCKSLASLQRYWEAVEVINLTLKLASNTISVEKKEELRSLGAQIAYNISDPTHGWDYVRHIVNQRPYGFSAWNCYYKLISRLENRYSKHNKFLHGMRIKHKDSIPPIVICGHQFTMISQHQAAAREYLEAYKLMPDSPLINLCVGTALINLALGFRLQNKHQCLLQGLAFLHNNLELCGRSQEALYNIARAYQHVGLVTLAASYYEKVLAIHEKDYPIPKLPNENIDVTDNRKSGYCDLRREAAYNLHLIYKKSGALDLARQVLRDHYTL